MEFLSVPVLPGDGKQVASVTKSDPEQVGNAAHGQVVATEVPVGLSQQSRRVVTTKDTLFQACPCLPEPCQPLFATAVKAGRILYLLHQSSQCQINAAGVYEGSVVIEDGEDGLKKIRQSGQCLCDYASSRMPAPDNMAVADFIFSVGKKSCSNLFNGLLQRSGMLGIRIMGSDQDQSAEKDPATMGIAAQLFYHCAFRLPTDGDQFVRSGAPEQRLTQFLQIVINQSDRTTHEVQVQIRVGTAIS